MEIPSSSSGKLLSELEMEEYNNFMQQQDLMISQEDQYYFDDFNFDQCFNSFKYCNSSSSPNHDHHLTTQTEIIERQIPTAKQLKSNSWSWSCSSAEKANSSSSFGFSSKLLSLDNSNSPSLTSQQHYYGFDYTCTTMKPNAGQLLISNEITSTFPTTTTTTDHHDMNIINTTPTQSSRGIKRFNTKNHVIAERNRREKLSQKFIALSALLPGLKKMDKASIIEGAIKYTKQLQERVKTLEEKTAKKSIESVVFVKRSQVYYGDDEISSSTHDENFDTYSDQPLPEIEARVSDRDVLIRIHCDNKHKGCLASILPQLEKLHLNVVNSSVLSFGSSTLDITIVARMDSDICMNVKDLVRKLRKDMLSSFDNKAILQSA